MIEPKHYDVLTRAVKPARVVTVARVGSLARAREVAEDMRRIGFEVIIEWKEPHSKRRNI